MGSESQTTNVEDAELSVAATVVISREVNSQKGTHGRMVAKRGEIPLLLVVRS